MIKIRKLEFKFLVFIIFVLLIFQVKPQIARADIISGDYQCTVSGSNAIITKYIGSGGDVTIPATIDGYTVTGIGDSAFFYCSNLTSVIIQVGGQAVLGRQDASPTPWLTERHGYDPT